ncbi:MAG: FHA domain-containing protein [Pyrinomonadaceae bacterium]
MAEKTTVSKKKISADWLLQGALSRIGDMLDSVTGRKWTPASSLATSGLIERLKKLLDKEAREVPGKGTVVPHNIKLKMQWDKFSTDAEDAIAKLQNELLIAAADHINDRLYYTYAPLKLEVKQDYFTEGVKLFVSFDTFAQEANEGELNVTMPAINIPGALLSAPEPAVPRSTEFIARFEAGGKARERKLQLNAGDRLSIGRTGSNDLVIDDASVSKIHASLALNAEGALSVADTGSTNGTFINGVRMSYGKASVLTEEDVVRFGSVDVVFEKLPDEPSSSAPEQDADDQTVQIDGFEFTSRHDEKTGPDIPSPDEEKGGEDETAAANQEENEEEEADKAE